MDKRIHNLIIRTITIIPGIRGISSMDFNQTNQALKKEEWSDGIAIEETAKGINISIAIIAEYNINTKIVAKEISSATRAILKKTEIQLLNLTIYVRGVK